MTAGKRGLIGAGLTVSLALWYPNFAYPDTLFRGKTAMKIGHGNQMAAKIDWTDCSGKNPATFNEPPYALDKADNCAVGPPTFGLECSGKLCKVVDQSKLQKYLPGVRNGDTVRLDIEERSVELRSDATTLRLER